MNVQPHPTHRRTYHRGLAVLLGGLFVACLTPAALSIVLERTSVSGLDLLMIPTVWLAVLGIVVLPALLAGWCVRYRRFCHCAKCGRLLGPPARNDRTSQVGLYYIVSRIFECRNCNIAWDSKMDIIDHDG